ncbi:cyclic-phosphate processing receiver domain-containing protein [Paenibacillus alvei]|uniref:Cell division protein FtsJ n=1 Tax=Paenibacillus alvei TaxID=44250 RepID=A0AAP7A3Q2_PAEAL|nr:cyclic-phosphate processing receiver domain-containing protein [Paenibacillus alvei]MBG9736233.1 cell division protein FtsJ [Paenibacillus alvei]MBG9745932.1 cell division protein FtsJ [Paenibacillus alvei]MCY9582665.1 cell division protein FtsJ [Paenibacillus alvei]MCY9587989.1 cell division protein FtsJ [Paenibacillus alvei]NEZ42193.1 cell division protein FtsJ [Paenibacillus alvei]
MIHVFLDDYRRCPEGFVLARNAEECLLLLEQEQVGILSLDHDLGADEKTGTDLVREIVLRGLYPQTAIYLHTSSVLGRKRMFEMLYANKPEHVQLSNGPMPDSLLTQIRENMI